MGINISYKGSLSDPSRLEEAIAEIKSFCVRAAWRCEDWTEHVSGLLLSEGEDPPVLIDEEFRGVYACPPETESLRFVFDKNGKLAHLMDVPKNLLTKPIEGVSQYFPLGHYCKTTGRPDSHMRICLLLRILQMKYMPDLEVHDDTDYWDTADFEKLCGEHAVMGMLVASMNDPANATALLRSAGVDIPEGTTVEVLDPNLEVPRPRRKAAKGPVN